MIFKRNNSAEKPTQPVDYPVGTLVQTEDGKFWLIRQQGRYLLPTRRIADSWSLPVAPTTYAALTNIKSAGTVGFRDSTLIKNFVDGKIYLIAGSKRRLVSNPDIIGLIGQSKHDILLVGQSEADLHEPGDDLV